MSELSKEQFEQPPSDIPETPPEVLADQVVNRALSSYAPDQGEQAVDPLGIYLGAIGTIPLLTKEEELDLARMSVSGNREAFDRLAVSNLRLVVSIAKRYSRRTGLPILDLIQEGNIGLMKGIDKFDPERGFKLSTYVTDRIRNEITRYVDNHIRTVRVPIHFSKAYASLLDKRDTLGEKLGREPSRAELAEFAGIGEDRVSELFSARGTEPVSLDEPVGGDGQSTLGDIISATPDSPQWGGNPEQFVIERLSRDLFKANLSEILKDLTPRQQAIIVMRFGLNNGVFQTLQEIADGLGYSKSMIAQDEQIALKKLREHKHAGKLLG